MTHSEFDIKFFTSQGFTRKVCGKCGRAFWSLGDWPTCGEPPCEEYSFIGNSPMKKTLDLHQMRETYLSFFEEHGHGRVKRYPIVARWRDDVFFTQASIYDFQPWVINEVIDPPANPLCISQTCVRFNDIDNVGKTGRHLTFFEMMAHHVFNKPGKEIYFKDRTVELCHQLLTERLGVGPEKVRYIEEWWEGGGNSGPCLEVILEGVELATLVFMQYRETVDGRKPMNMKVVDTGYGLERFTWVSQATPSAYEAVFGPVVRDLKASVGANSHHRALVEYAKVAGMTNAKTAADVRTIRERTAERLGIAYQDLMQIISPLEDIYVICDHSRALAFMLNDGVVPSNVREGYFARLLVRRGLRSMRSLGFDQSLAEIVGKQIDYFSGHFPELIENKEDIMNLVSVEEQRYYETLDRGKSLVQRLSKDLPPGGKFSTEKLIELYDSHGLNPEIVKEFTSAEVDIPDNFYMQVAKRHDQPDKVEVKQTDLPQDAPETRMLYYENPDLFKFEATVVGSFDGGIILNQTAFYPEGGGQENDAGVIDGIQVKNVIKVRNTIVHYLDGGKILPMGKKVEGEVDKPRRLALMRHHTAAHIINGVARSMFGNHVWQAGAHKSTDEARLDLTHYENLTPEQRERLEVEVNRVVLEDIKVDINFMPRDEAEKSYGFRLYQGGAVPGKMIRVVNTRGVDTEACGGLHCSRTSKVGPIRILRTKRIQDGVVRIEFSAGLAAVKGMQEDKQIVDRLSDELNVTRDQVLQTTEKAFSELRDERKRCEGISSRYNDLVATRLMEKAHEIEGKKVVVHLVGEGEDPTAISLALTSKPGVIAIVGWKDKTPKLFVSCSSDIQVDCRPILKEVMKLVGGGGGGKKEFAQGGGGDPNKLPSAMEKAPGIVRALLQKAEACHP